MIFGLILGIIFFCIFFFIKNQKISYKYNIEFILLYIILHGLVYPSMNGFHILSLPLMVISILSILYFHQKNRKKTIWKFISFFIIAFFIEIFICNFRHFITLFNQEITIDSNQMIFENIKKEGNNYTILDDKSAIKILNINKQIKNIHLDIEIPKISGIQLLGSDEGNKEIYSLGKRFYGSNILKSQYIPLHFYGKTKDFVINLTSLGKGTSFQINEISFNVVVPVMFEYLRFLLLFIGISIGYIIWPKSKFYRYKLFDKNIWKKYFIISFVLSMIIFFFVAVHINKFFEQKHFDSYDSYYELTEAILDGHFYLNEEVPNFIKEMDNPYDIEQRSNILKENGYSVQYRWDYAYYNGKFYVYFGILPVLLLFLPFYVIFGIHLPMKYSIFILCSISVGAVLYFVWQLCKRYYPKISLISYLLGSSLLILCSGFVFIARRPDIYLIPLALSLCLVYFGFGFILKSLNCEKRKYLYLGLGMFCLALTSLSRPQFLVSIILAIPLIKNELYHGKWDKKAIFSTLCPLIVVGAFAMYYNYARFGSIFDFGASYNLTTNDMTHRGINIDRIGLGIFNYLFKPLEITSTFPFIEKSMLKTNYMGITIYENFLGGLFWNTCVVLLGFYVIKHKKQFPKELYQMSILCYILAFIVIFFDIEAAGILPRYLCDFAYLFLIPTIFVLFRNESKKDIKFQKIFIYMMTISFVYQFLLLFQYVDMSLSIYSPEIFYNVYYFLQFWV